MLASICLLALSTIIGYWFFTKNFNYWKDRGVNGPKPLPIFGNLIDIIRTPRTELELKYYRNYGKIYGYYLGSAPVLVVGELELIKNILVKDFHIFPQRRIPTTSHPVMKSVVSNIVGNDWKRVRSITSPTFTSSKMKLMYPLMEECLDEFMVHLDDLANTKSNVNIKDIYGSLTIDIIASSAFAIKLNSLIDMDSMFVTHAKALFKINPIKMILLRIFPKFVFKMVGSNDDPNPEGLKSKDFYVKVVRQMIEERKSRGQKMNDFVQLLMDADQSDTNEEVESSESHHVNQGKEELEAEKKTFNVNINSSNRKLSEDEIIAQAVAFLLAGYETTATTLTLATYELALNPDVQDKLCDEVNASLNSNGKIDYEVLCRLPYLDAIISETLRRHSPAVKTIRLAAREYNVGDTGITVYPGQQVEIPIHAIHHDEKYYENPFKFEPERFMPHNRHKLVPYTYLPFGAGPRNCLGMRFALLETKLALAQLVRRYRFLRCNETDVPLINDRKSMLCAPIRAIVGIEMRN